jgi:type II secretory pathway pseudopilin PulG
MTIIPPRRGVRHAFTLLELLVVIGIIIILLGMLVPVINKVRYATYSANTSQEISQLQNAINQYYATFHAYPGPFSNDQIENVVTGGIPIELYTVSTSGVGSYGTFTNSPTNNGSTSTTNITGTQNLVLGLLGGLRIDPGATAGGTTANDPAFAPGEVGLGPLNLNGATNPSYIPQRFPPFLNVGSGGNSTLLMWSFTGTAPNNRSSQAPTNQFGNLTGFQDLTGTNTPYDAAIPVFVDRYPDPGPLPILYLRARTSSQGIISFQQQPGPYNYDIQDISPYTGAANTPSHIGLPKTDPAGNIITHQLYGVTSGTFIMPPNISVKGAGSTSYLDQTAGGIPDTGAYFMDKTIPPTNLGSNSLVDQTGRPRAVDSFILISAGADGVYGTSDDITSFGSASQ